ncbi:MAG: hypothetical protein LUG21_05815 [Clostridiales bacterium]|nr:hypothetical protein [Clostridiales bacterium]
MSYLIAKKFKTAGCIAIKTNLGKDLLNYVNNLEECLDDDIEVVVISNPDIFGEYKPYKFVHSYDEFKAEASEL